LKDSILYTILKFYVVKVLRKKISGIYCFPENICYFYKGIFYAFFQGNGASISRNKPHGGVGVIGMLSSIKIKTNERSN